MKRIVYVCHPFRDDAAGNREKVAEICRQIKDDYIPLAPHLAFDFLDEETERERAL